MEKRKYEVVQGCVSAGPPELYEMPEEIPKEQNFEWFGDNYMQLGWSKSFAQLAILAKVLDCVHPLHGPNRLHAAAWTRCRRYVATHGGTG